MTLNDKAKAARREYQRTWQKEHPEKLRQYMAKWKKKNPERVKAYRKKWIKDHPEKVKEYQQRYWTKKAAEIEARQASVKETANG